MKSLAIKHQPQIKQEKLSNQLNQQKQKQQVSSNTEPPQDPKVKLQTKCIGSKKEEGKNIQFSDELQQHSNDRNEGQVDAQRGRNVRRRVMSHHDRIQDVRLVATNFIEHGLNFRKFNKFYPDIEAKFYRNTVQAINNTSINEIQKFLRYQCNIQIEKLNRDQKRSIRTQLTKVREWLGKKDMGQLQTLYKFIQRKYQLIDVEISIEEALKLYKTILQIVKSPFVDVMEDDIKPDRLDPQINKLANKEQKQTQQKALIFLYIQHKNLTKVSDLLCEKFGYTLKWSKHAVKQKIKFLLKNSLKKLIGSVEAYDKALKLFFSQSDECVDLLIKSQHSLNLRVFLLGFHLQKTISLIELREYIKNVNKFFIQQYKGHGQYECKQFEQGVKIPKLQLKKTEFLQKQLKSKSNKIYEQSLQCDPKIKREDQKIQLENEIENKCIKQQPAKKKLNVYIETIEFRETQDNMKEDSILEYDKQFDEYDMQEDEVNRATQNEKIKLQN